jgi:ElaB/YqjD/DUF883 family membrane-anchored ribosome-binding protein
MCVARGLGIQREAIRTKEEAMLSEAALPRKGQEAKDQVAKDQVREQWDELTDEASGSLPAGERLTSVREGLNTVGNCVSDTVETARRRMAEFRDHGFDRVTDDVVKYTKEQPTNALLVAAGLGLLLGIFSGLRRR